MYFWAVHVSSGSPVVQHHHPLTKWVTTSVHKHITVLVFTSLTSGDVNLSLLLSHLTCEQSAFLAHWLLPFICDQADFLILGQTFSHSPLWQRHRSWCVDVHWWFTSTDLEAVSLQSKLLDQPSVLSCHAKKCSCEFSLLHLDETPKHKNGPVLFLTGTLQV